MSDHEERLRLIALNIAKENLASTRWREVYDVTHDADISERDVAEVLMMIRHAKVEILDV